MTRGNFTKLPERNLDVLRAIAVLLVLFSHVSTAFSPTPGHATLRAAEMGHLGVLIFFVHTSLVLMSSLERGGTEPGWVHRFYLRRAFRIYPLAIFAVILVTALSIPAANVAVGHPVAYHVPGLSSLAANLLLVQNLVGKDSVLTVLWSLPIEVQMYVVLPLCWILARRSLNAVLCLAVAFVALAFAVAYLPVPGIWRLTVFLFGPCFMGGVLAYALLRYDVPRVIPAWGIVVAALVGAIWLMLVNATSATFVLNWVPCLVLAVMIPLVRPWADTWLTTAAHTIAEYSYGIYLLHVPALWLSLIVLRGAPVVVQWTVFSVLMFALPFMAYHGIERPGIRLGRYLSAAPPPQTLDHQNVVPLVQTKAVPIP